MRLLIASLLFVSCLAFAGPGSGVEDDPFDSTHREDVPKKKSRTTPPPEEQRVFNTDELTRICNGAPLGVANQLGQARGPVGAQPNKISVRFVNGSFYFYRADANGRLSAVGGTSRFPCSEVNMDPPDGICTFAPTGSDHVFDVVGPEEVRTVLRNDSTGQWTVTTEYRPALLTGQPTADQGMVMQRVTMPNGSVVTYQVPSDRYIGLVNGELRIFPRTTQISWPQAQQRQQNYYYRYYGGAPYSCGSR